MADGANGFIGFLHSCRVAIINIGATIVVFMAITGDAKIKKMMADVKTLKIQGAKNVAIAGARTLKISAEQSKAKDARAFICEMESISKKIQSLRPTEPALRNGQNIMLSEITAMKNLSLHALRINTAKICDDYVLGVQSVLGKIAQLGSRIITDGDVVMTHCHSNSVVEILKAAKKHGKKFKVIVTETRPLYQGQVTAKELADEKIEVIYCIDAASASLMSMATKVLVGADAIASDGSVVNKIGTYQIAIEAKEHSVPFFVACGTHKYDPMTAQGHPEPIEERGKDEIVGRAKLKGVSVVNPAFDVTPKEYVREIITEIGAYSPEALVSILESRSRQRGR